MRSNRFFSLLAMVTIAFAVPAQESASTYPSKPIRLVVNSAPGGFNDVVGGVLVDQLATDTEIKGQQAFVDNKPGGGG